MTISLLPVQNLKAGTCPHGLPPGACPICSGAGGGGGGAAKKADFSAKSGEMSWADCSAIGQIMKNKKMAKLEDKNSLQAQLVAAMNFEKNVANFAIRMTNFVMGIQKTIPAILARPIAFLAMKLLIPVLNILKDIPLNVQKTMVNVVEKLIDISDKLAAIYGELKNSIEKKISDKLKDFKKKISSFFGLFEAQESEENQEEDRRVEEAKKAFELKTVLETLQEKFTQKEENQDDEN